MSQPMEPGEKRKLAVIMFMDMVSYSALMSKNEQETLLNVKALEAMLRREAEAEDGRIVKFLGDGSMTEFPTATGAVRCAQGLMGSLLERNRSVRAKEAFQVRIGLNLGEVWEDGRDLYGDAVNIAARVQAFARPGEIAMTDAVLLQARNKVSLVGVRKRKVRLKNIPERTDIFLLPPAGRPFTAWAFSRGGEVVVPRVTRELWPILLKNALSSLLGILLALVLTGALCYYAARGFFADTDEPRGEDGTAKIGPGQLLEGWEGDGRLAWSAEDGSVVLKKTEGEAMEGKEGLKVQLDFSKYAWPKIYTRLMPAWDLDRITALHVDVFVPRGLPGTVSLMPFVSGTVQYFGVRQTLKIGWNRTAFNIKKTRMDGAERRHVVEAGWMVFCDNKGAEGWVVLDNFKAE